MEKCEIRGRFLTGGGDFGYQRVIGRHQKREGRPRR
jgi:hypothetical protein